MDRKNVGTTFNDVAEFVRGWARVPAKKQITPDTQFERDLGITGDDGDDLLEATQKHFKVNFTDGRTAFAPSSNSAQTSTCSTRRDSHGALAVRT